MNKNIYKSKAILILLSTLVLSTSMVGCKKQQNSKSEVSLAATNDVKENTNSENTSIAKDNEKKDESKEVSNNKNEKAKEEGAKGPTTVNQKQVVNPSAAQVQVKNTTSAVASSQPSTSTGTPAQSSSTTTSGTSSQQNQGTSTQANQGQSTGSSTTTAQPSGGTTPQGSGGTTSQDNGGTTQTGGNEATPPKPRPDSVAVSGDKVVAYASSFLQTPYRFNGTTPDGFDASGFVQYVFKHFGIDVGRTTYEQIKAGTSVSKDQLKIGDLVFFGSAESPHHVGIYVGNNTYIHSPQTGDVVKVSPLDRGDFVAVRRVF